MTKNQEIIYVAQPSTEEIQSLYDGIATHAQLKKNQPPIESFGFFVYSDSQKVLAGCSGDYSLWMYAIKIDLQNFFYL